MDNEAKYADLQKRLRTLEAQFRLWNGLVDLMAMSAGLTTDEFREYVNLSRVWREALRKPVS